MSSYGSQKADGAPRARKSPPAPLCQRGEMAHLPGKTSRLLLPPGEGRDEGRCTPSRTADSACDAVENPQLPPPSAPPSMRGARGECNALQSCRRFRFPRQNSGLLHTLLALTLLASLLTGCGYKFRGQSSALPPHIKTVAIPIFENHTSELGLENVLTQKVIAEFNRRQMLKVKTVDHADAVLSGVIFAIHYSPVSYGADERATERRVQLTVNVSMKDVSTGKMLWSRQGLTYLESYAVAAKDPVLTDYNKQAALAKISDNLAEKIHDFLFSGF